MMPGETLLLFKRLLKVVEAQRGHTVASVGGVTASLT